MSTNRQIWNANRSVSGVPKLGVIIVLFLIGLVIMMVLHARSQAEHTVSPIEVLLGTPAGPSNEVAAITEGDVTVYVPPGATELDGTVSITLAEADLSLVVDESEWILPKVVNVEFQGSNGAPIPDISFSEPVEICFNMTEEQWQAYRVQPGAYQVQHYADKADPPRWEVLPEQTYPDRRQLCGQTYDLSIFGLAVKVDAEIPVPVTGPTITRTPVPTRTAFQPQPTQARRERDDSNSSSGGASQPTATNPPPTATEIQPTNTPRPTSTPRPLTNTPRPTNTSVPSTNTPRPTNTSLPQPTSTNPPTSPPQPTNTDPPPTQQPTDPPPPTEEPPPPTQEPTDEPTVEPIQIPIEEIIDLIEELFPTPSGS